MRRSGILALAASVVLAGCARIDTTEHCFETMYGDIKDDHMDPGLNLTLFTDVTCFPTTDVNFPGVDEDGGARAETMEAQTSDPVTVTGDLAITFRYDPSGIADLFREKRTEEAARVEVMNAIRSGYRDALASWSVAEIFSPQRPFLADSVKHYIQRRLGNRAQIVNVFIRDIRIPQQIEQARIEAARQEQILSAARQQFTIDSVRATTLVMTAEAEAEAKRQTAEAYRANPMLLELEMAQAFRDGLRGACSRETVQGNGARTATVAQTCVIGGSVVDAFMARGQR